MTDEECANARRAAAAVALEAERARAPALEEASEAKLVALRDREARTSSAGQQPTTDGTSLAPAFGTPVGSVMPSMSRSPSFDVYADGADPLGRHSIEVAAAEPPANELVIEEPRLETTDLAVIPRPFRDDAAQR